MSNCKRMSTKDRARAASLSSCPCVLPAPSMGEGLPGCDCELAASGPARGAADRGLGHQGAGSRHRESNAARSELNQNSQGAPTAQRRKEVHRFLPGDTFSVRGHAGPGDAGWYRPPSATQTRHPDFQGSGNPSPDTNIRVSC